MLTKFTVGELKEIINTYDEIVVHEIRMPQKEISHLWGLGQKDTIIGTLELIKKKFSKTSISLAAHKPNTDWNIKQDNLSTKYTTNVRELLIC